MTKIQSTVVLAVHKRIFIRSLFHFNGETLFKNSFRIVHLHKNSFEFEFTHIILSCIHLQTQHSHITDVESEKSSVDSIAMYTHV